MSERRKGIGLQYRNVAQSHGQPARALEGAQPAADCLEGQTQMASDVAATHAELEFTRRKTAPLEAAR